jgi:HSP20 family molecular chaperone IbpA
LQTKKNTRNTFLDTSSSSSSSSSSESEDEEERNVTSHKNMKNMIPKTAKLQGRIIPQSFLQTKKNFSNTRLDTSSSSSSSSSESEDEEECKVKSLKNMKKNVIPKTRKVQDRFNPKSFLQTKKPFLDEQQESSSSSSESEDEYESTMKPSMDKTMRRQQPTPKMWFTVANFEGFCPKDLTVKLNPKFRILVIKAEKNVHRQELKKSQPMGGKLIQMILLPEDIHLKQFRVQMTPNGQVIMMAPFLIPGEHIQQQRYPSIWVPVRVTLKEKNFPDTKQGTMDPKTPTEYGRKQTKNVPRMPEVTLIQQQTPVGQYFRPELIRDNETGTFAMIVNVNTVGFLPKEVRVRVDQTKRRLIVVASKKGSLETTEQGIATKYLHREFILPRCLDVPHIVFHVLKNGLLIVKLPILKNKESKLKEMLDVDVDVEEEEQQWKNVEWKKPKLA